MFQEPCTRTNNDVEGWHRRINTKAGRTTLQFYLLVPLLHQEADHVDLTAKLLSSDKINQDTGPTDGFMEQLQHY